MLCRIPEAALAALLVLIPILPAQAGEDYGCGKIYQNQDCGIADYQAILDQQQAAAAEAAKALPPPADNPAGETAPASNDMRQRAIELYRARAAAMANTMQCCHPGADGTLWCH